MMALGESVRELREETGKSLRCTADEIGVSPSFLSDVELGKRIPSNKMLRRIADSLGILESDVSLIDTRPPIEEFKNACKNPEYSVIMRRLLSSGISALDIDAFINSKIKV